MDPEKKRVNLPDKHLDRDPLTREDMHRATQDRIYEISREFTQGFKFLEAYPKSVTFFGSARFKQDNAYYKDAAKLASRIVTELSYSIISGGGPGIMEASNRGAEEAGGNSIGLTIRLPRGQVLNNYLTNHIDFYYFFSRKVCLTYSSEAFIFYPGGYGTLDEFFEIITLLQTRKIPTIPVILVGSDYWNEVKVFIEKTLLERGTVDTDDMTLFTITDSHDQVLQIIKNAPVHEYLPYKGLRVNPIDE